MVRFVILRVARAPTGIVLGVYMGSQMPKDEKEEVVALSVRLPADAHRSVTIAAARANLSVSGWLAEVGAAASASANAMFLVEELGSRSMERTGVVEETMLKALDLLKTSLDHSGAQTGEVSDVLAKLGNLLESRYGAQAIHSDE